MLFRHLQTPDGDYGNNQDHQVRHNIDDRCRNDKCRLIETLFSPGLLFLFVYALGRDHEDQGNGVEQVKPEDEPDAIPYCSSARLWGNKDALIEEHD